MSGIPWKHAVAVPVLLLLYFYGLTRVGLLGPDEPRYAAIGREMAASGDFVTPRLWGEPWFEKPALLYWLIALGYLSGLAGEAAVRVPVAIVSTGFLFLFFHRLRREFGEKAALYASMVLASCAGWLAYSHVAVTDVPLAAAFGGAILLFLPWIRSGGRRGLVIGGLLLGLAVLAKGLVPLVLALPVTAIAAMRRRWVDLIIMAAACVAIAAPWYVACWMQNGQVFIDEFIYKHHFGRFLSPDLQHVQSWWYYGPVLLGLVFPWTPALVLLFRREDYRDHRKLFLGVVAALGFVFFSASTNKLAGYLLPLVPPIAALVGIRFADMSVRPALFASAAILLGLVPIVAVVLPSALVYGARRTPAAWAADINVLLIVPFAVLAAICWAAESRGKRATAAGLIFGATTVAVVALKTFTFPILDAKASARTLWPTVRDAGPTPCFEDVPRSIREGLNFYAGYVLPPCSSTRDRVIQ